MGPTTFLVHEVQKIIVLDITLTNDDRHGGNILIYNEGKSSFIILITIDHGYHLT